MNEVLFLVGEERIRCLKIAEQVAELARRLGHPHAFSAAKSIVGQIESGVDPLSQEKFEQAVSSVLGLERGA